STLHFSLLLFCPDCKTIPILMSILLYHFKQLTQCISEAERIEAKLNSSKNKGSTKEKEEEQLAQPTAVPQQRQGQLRLSEF
ncbi:MAG TPA: hypothetical protein VFG77_01075, partial [Nitrososphaeraceae archaeon]|nr:hypothetical protein [Nitrososphaeraceae archaeon]